MIGDKILFLGFITSFLVVLLATPSLIKVAKLKHLVDEPGEDRKLHSRSVPTIGGIIIFGAIESIQAEDGLKAGDISTNGPMGLKKS